MYKIINTSEVETSINQLVRTYRVKVPFSTTCCLLSYFTHSHIIMGLCALYWVFQLYTMRIALCKRSFINDLKKDSYRIKVVSEGTLVIEVDGYEREFDLLKTSQLKNDEVWLDVIYKICYVNI